MKNKAFTLIELLAVIVILALLALLTTTSITKLVRDAKSDLSEIQINLIESAAEAFGAENLNRLPKDGKCKYFTLKDLKESGLLDTNIVDAMTNKEISDDLKIKVTTTNVNGKDISSYEVNPESVSGCSNMETICMPVKYSELGNAPEGNYELGDEYICKVAPGVNYNFYVLSTEGTDNVNLLMSENLDDKVIFQDFSGERLDTEEYYDYMTGSQLVLDYIETVNTLTSNWYYINPLEMEHNFLNYTISLDGYHARLATYEEIAAQCPGIGSSLYENPEDEAANHETAAYRYGCSDWVLGNYWLMDTTDDNGWGAGVWAVNTEYNTLDDISIREAGYGYNGIRPVITVSKTDLG